MTDPRFKSGMIRSDWHKQPQVELDTPLAHGWQRIGVNEQGYSLFQLDEAVVRAMTPRERCITGGDWIVFVKGQPWATFSGPLEQITQQVKTQLAIPFDGEPCLQQDGTQIAEAGI